MSILVTDAILGQTVTFSSKNPVDPTVYKGIISGIIAYSVAGTYGFDLLSYNAAVQRADPSVGDITILNYFIITLTNDQPQPAVRVFADEWISKGSFSVIQNATIYNINVYDLPSKGVNEIVSVLRAAGYNAVPVTTPSASSISQGQT